MLVYILLFIFIAILAIDYEFNQVKSDVMLAFVALSLGLLAGFRHPDAGRDYPGYQYAIETLHQNTDTFVFVIFELGFVFILDIVGSIFIHNHELIIIFEFALLSVI